MSARRLIAATVVSVLSASLPALAAGENTMGRWSSVIGLPLVPSSGAVLKNGKVLLWSADGEFKFESAGQVHSTVFDPETLTNTKQVTQAGHNMFCTGTTLLADGTVLANGGSNAAVTTLYDPASNRFTRVQDMKTPRGYNANTILADGSVFTLGGSWTGAGTERPGEIWTREGGWRTLTGVPMTNMTSPDPGSSFGHNSHLWLIPGGNGKVFYAGPSPTMQWIGTSGNGSVTEAGRRGDDTFAVNGTAVMYDTGRILKAGGSAAYSGAAATARAYDIDIRNGASVTKTVPMTYARGNHNSVVLPDGKVMLVGGQSFLVGFSDSDSIMAPELWDPATGLFTPVAPISVPRNYHSIALLLPDGRVLSGGGGLCGTCSANHPDVQLYSPPYLFDANGAPAVRPSILSAPETLPYGRTVTVTTDRPISKFSIVRQGAATHTVNNDQRRLSLTFRQTGTNVYEIDVPSNAGYLLPGHWMLFAMDDSGTPSVAKIVQVGVNAIAVLESPGTLVGQVGRALSALPVTTKLSSSTRFGGTGLPAGVTVDPVTGQIAGSPTAAGTFRASLTATNGTETVSTDFAVTIDPAPGDGDGLLGEYFANTTLSGTAAFARRETPNFDFGGRSPASGVPADNFSVRWSGEIIAARGGTHRFRTESDDGVRLWVDGKLLVDNWTTHAPTVDEGQIDLVAGRSYPVLLEYYNGTGGSVLRLTWSRPGDTAFAPIPLSELRGRTVVATNLALGKPATQSSTFESAAAGRAVDGSTNGAYGQGSVSHTASEPGAWWQVDLQTAVAVDRVTLWNRTDCCATRLRDFVVFLSPTDMTGRSLASLLADPAVAARRVGASTIPASITAPGGVTARFVRVQLNGTDFLHLAEVQVFGTSANRAPSITAPASQIGSLGQAAALQVVASDPDGDRLTFAAAGLPAGLAIDPSTGRIAGTPTVAGSFAATVTATDVGGAAAEAPLSWTVVGALPSVTKLVVTPRLAGQPVSYGPIIGNGVGATYSWDFGDGTPVTAFSSNPAIRHTFANPGIYPVTLVLRAADGRARSYRFDQAIHLAAPSGPVAAASSGMAVESRPGASERLWVVNPDNNSVAVVDVATRKLVAEIQVGPEPVAVAIDPSRRAWVLRRDAAIRIVDTQTLQPVATYALPAGSRPGGLVMEADGSAIVTLEATGQIARVYASGAFGGSATIGGTPRFLALNRQRDRAFVSRFITAPLPGEGTATVSTVDANGNPLGGEVTEVDMSGTIRRRIVLQHSERQDTTISARGIPNYLGAPALSPDGKTAWVPSKQDNVKRGQLRDGKPLDFQTSVRAILSKVDLATGREDLSKRVDLDNSGLASAALVHPNGAYVFVALSTSREVAVVDPVGATELFRFNVGRAPSSLALSADGSTLFVGNFMDRTVTIVHLNPLFNKGVRAVTILGAVSTIVTEALPAQVLRGKQFFYDAADRRLARDGYLACAVCHDGGEADGRTWDFTSFGEGLRNTASLTGHGGPKIGRLHWSGNFDEVQDFEGPIRSFAGGTGLMRDAAFFYKYRSQPIGTPKAGVSADLDALAAYVTSLTALPVSPFRGPGGGLTASGAEGKLVFERLRCATCHAGPTMTISTTSTTLKSVGTIKPSSGERLGAPLTGLDVPTLLGVWATAPYLHDGSAPTLNDAILAHKTVRVTRTERAMLVNYLRQIGPTP